MNDDPIHHKFLKIMHVVAGSACGGAETFCLDAILALHDEGIGQHVICRPHAHLTKMLDARDISYQTMSFRGLDRLFHGKRTIRKATRSFAPDVVHAWLGRAASYIPENLGVPVLGWFGGYYDLKRYRTSDFYMGVTKDIVRYISEKSGKPERSFLVHTFGTLADLPVASRAMLDTPEDAPVVLMLSRMHWKKGVDTLLDAAARLPGVYFWLAGDGPDLEKYKEMARRKGLGDRVRFLGWRTDRAALLKAADICVLPSRYEPFGTVMAEAWHMRVPLVAARAAGPLQYIVHNENGLLCDIDDPAGLAEQVARVLTDPVLKHTLVMNGSETYAKCFSKSVVIGELLKTYARIAHAGKGKGAASLSYARTASAFRSVAIILCALLMSGCVAVWGKAYTIEFQSPSVVTIHYDSNFTDQQNIEAVARSHCAQYGGDAKSISESTSVWGLTTAEFSCKK